MYMRKILNFALIAATVCSISFAVTSCKDDDDSENSGENNNGGNEVETIEGMSTLEDDQLADLICKWTDTHYDQLGGSAWRSKTYDATVGLALDASRPGVRTMPVGTLEEADSYAVSALGTLGIDYETPSGFTYSNELVGKLSYQHVSDGNALGVISVDVKQMPALQEIRLVKSLPENAGGDPYYKCGDLVKYKNRIYVCVSKHEYGQEARFINVNDQSTHSRGSFGYWGVGTDSVYNDEMAKAEVIGDWLQNVVCDYDMWMTVCGYMTDTGNKDNIRQVVPEDNMIRTTFIDNLIEKQNYIPDLQKVNPLEGDVGRIDVQKFTLQEDDLGTYMRAIYAPVGFLLADKLRYTQIKDKWVPYIFLAKGDTFFQVYYWEHELPSQAGDPSHFKFKALNIFAITEKDSLIGKPTFLQSKGQNIKASNYCVCVVGMHWTHDSWIDSLGQPFKSVYNFLTDYLRHPNQKDRAAYNQRPTDEPQPDLHRQGKQEQELRGRVYSEKLTIEN